MSYYSLDRQFTDKVHKAVALKEIYPLLGWEIDPIDSEKLKEMDMKYGIDYVLKTASGKRIYVQERFREYKYCKYTDVTLRYRRDHNSDSSKHRSEFFKIKADYLVYGIINGSKEQTLSNEKEISSIKFAVIDIKVLFKNIMNGNIVIDPSIRKSEIRGSKLYAPINENTDYSSNFVAFDVEMLNKLFGHQNIVILQKGYF